MVPSRSELLLVAIVLSLLVSPVVSTLALGDQHDAEPPNACVGTIEDPPDEQTIVSIQGARFTDEGAEKTTSWLLAVEPDGTVDWVHDRSAEDRWYTYDVDPLPNGNLLLAETEPDVSVVSEYDPDAGEAVWTEQFEDVGDLHDADLLGEHELALADKDNNRVLVYNLTTEEYVWEWYFDDRYDPDAGGDYEDDWTHLNDVDELPDGRLLVSPRNFDQALVLDRGTGEIDMRLGADDDYDVLNEQHNPDYLESEDGTPTILVADSRNDRVVEYARDGGPIDGNWTRTWVLEGGGLAEPRDADRLPNGNTLVTDRLGHRVFEVTPDGEIVWEFYAPWQPYDAERPDTGPGSSGPTMRDLNATGTTSLEGSAPTEAELDACTGALEDRDRTDDGGLFDAVGSSDLLGERETTGDRSDSATTDADAEPTATSPSGVGLLVVSVAVLGALLAIALRRR